MRLSRQGRALWLACVLCNGCAHTARVTYWQPAELDATGVQRLAVVPFVGEHGPEIAEFLESRLWEEDTYSLADRSELGSAILTTGFPHDEFDDLPRLLAASQEAGIDGVILGEVHEYGVDTSDRLARVELSLRLVDTRTGDVCASREIRREAAVRNWDIPPRQSDDLALQKLSQDCVREFMSVLVPQPATAEVRLAGGEWYAAGGRDIRRGIRLARQGRWDEAEELWHTVLERTPASHAALYNLAVAAGQRQDFAAAEDFAMQALRQHHTDCYAKGLDQLRQFRADADRIARQRQAQVIQASLTAWQD